MFKRIVAAAALAGLLSGLLLTAIQQFQVASLIRQAEVLEAAAGAAPALILSTAVANVALAMGFALLLGAAFSLRGKAGWRAGLVWGAAGYAVFFAAPSLGLPPELPGTQAAALHARQWWWLGTVVFSAAGLWLAVFAGNPALRVLGVALLLAPHLVGAPQPSVHASTATAELASAFTRATWLANAVFWLALGGLLGFFYRR